MAKEKNEFNITGSNNSIGGNVNMNIGGTHSASEKGNAMVQEEVYDLIAEDRVEDAVLTLQDKCGENVEIRKFCTLTLRRIKALQFQQANNVIDKEKALIDLNNIAISVLNIADSLD